MRDADIGGIDVAINVEIGDVAVFFFAHEIREPAYGEKIVGFIEREAVFSVETIAGQDFRGYWLRGERRLLAGYVVSDPFTNHDSFAAFQARLQGRFTNVAAPQKSRNNKLI